MFLIRLLIVGETGVGKTSLLIRFNEDQFILNQKTTIGVDYKAKEVEIGNELVKLQVIPILFVPFQNILFTCLPMQIRYGILLGKRDFVR